MKEVKITKGQKVWLIPTGNMARRGHKDPKEAIVTSVGSKYIGVSDGTYRDLKFHADGLAQKTESSTDWALYLDIEDYKKDVEASKIVKDIREVFNGYGMPKISFETLKEIHNLLKS